METTRLRQFVLQDHIAERAGRHYDFRIQYPNKKELISWALPKHKIPKYTGEKVLAVRTEDHDSYWLNFQGKIPSGEYGGGTVKITQRGSLEILKWDSKGITFICKSGSPISGKYHLILTSKEDDKQESWLLIKGSNDNVGEDE